MSSASKDVLAESTANVSDQSSLATESNKIMNQLLENLSSASGRIFSI